MESRDGAYDCPVETGRVSCAVASSPTVRRAIDFKSKPWRVRAGRRLTRIRRPFPVSYVLITAMSIGIVIGCGKAAPESRGRAAEPAIDVGKNGVGSTRAIPGKESPNLVYFFAEGCPGCREVAEAILQKNTTANWEQWN